ncbi:MAG: alpha/beta fold hydrolase [Cyanobacteria bacterium J06639_18]
MNNLKIIFSWALLVLALPLSVISAVFIYQIVSMSLVTGNELIGIFPVYLLQILVGGVNSWLAIKDVKQVEQSRWVVLAFAVPVSILSFILVLLVVALLTNNEFIQILFSVPVFLLVIGGCYWLASKGINLTARLLFSLALPFGIVSAVVVYLATAQFTNNIYLLILVSALVFTTVAVGLSFPATRSISIIQRLRLILAVPFGIFSAVTVLIIIAPLGEGGILFLASSLGFVSIMVSLSWFASSGSLLSQRLRLVLAVPLSIVSAIAAFFLTALLSSHISLIMVGSILALVLTAGKLYWSASCSIKPQRRQHWHRSITSVQLLLAGACVAVPVLRPLNIAYSPKQQISNSNYWQLSTKSRIAYTHVAAVGKAKTTPVIFLHGGPGGSYDSREVNIFGRLAINGFNVYLYDQVGGGFSNRLANVEEYSVKRHVADLEAIRKQIGAKQVILIGHSWGGVLAAHYMTVHPNRVAKVILSSPGPAWRITQNGITQDKQNKSDRNDRHDRKNCQHSPDRKRKYQQINFMPRLVLVNTLLRLNPQAAYNLTGDREMDSWLEAYLSAYIDLEESKTVCQASIQMSTHPMSNFSQSPSGYYGFMLTGYDALRPSADIRSKLADNLTPTLILRGESEFVPWEAAYGYKQTLPNSKLLNIKNAGHFLYTERPELYFSIVRAFLLEQSLPLPPYSSSQPSK